MRRFRNTYELLYLRALKKPTLYKNDIFQWMGSCFVGNFNGTFKIQRQTSYPDIEKYVFHSTVYWIWNGRLCVIMMTSYYEHNFGVISFYEGNPGSGRSESWCLFYASMKKLLTNSRCFDTSWGSSHDNVIKWKHFPRNWPFVLGIHWSPVNSPHKGQWRWALMFSLICAWINGWVNNREAGDLRRHRGHYDVNVMVTGIISICVTTLLYDINTTRPIQNGPHFADDIFKSIFFDEYLCICIQISLKLISKGQMNNMTAWVYIMTEYRTGEQPTSHFLNQWCHGLMRRVCAIR